MSKSNHKQETLADIMAGMRYGAIPKHQTDHELLAIYADRIEAAAKREREIADAKIADLQSRVKLWTDRSAELVKKCNEHYANAHKSERGNAAAMREALLLCYRIIHCAMVAGVINRDDANKAMDAYHAALAAPPRNCDKMPDIDRLTMNDLAKSPCKSTLECASREELLALVRWLLAPAKEGGNDGR